MYGAKFLEKINVAVFMNYISMSHKLINSLTQHLSNNALFDVHTLILQNVFDERQPLECEDFPLCSSHILQCQRYKVLMSFLKLMCMCIYLDVAFFKKS